MLWWQQWQSSLHFPCSRLTQWPAEVTEAGWRTVEGWGSLRSTPVTVWAKVCLIADLSHIQQYFSLSTNTHVTHKTMHSHISIYLSIYLCADFICKGGWATEHYYYSREPEVMFALWKKATGYPQFRLAVVLMNHYHASMWKSTTILGHHIQLYNHS